MSSPANPTQSPEIRKRNLRAILLLILVGSGGLIVGICSTTNSVKETVNRRNCAFNLHNIGLALLQYANEHDGTLPTTLDVLLSTTNISPVNFVCMSSNETPATGPTTQALVANFETPGHLSYIYLGKDMLADILDPKFIVAHDKPDNHRYDGITVLYGDFSCEFIPKPQSDGILAELKAGQNPPHNVK